MQHSILVVDDEKDILDSLERQLRSQYKIFKAVSGYDALKILQKENISLILSDQRMPEMTGVQLFEKAQIVKPDAIRILLTGYTDVESVISAINNGQIYRYVTKPWDPLELNVVIKRALESFDLRSELKEKNMKLEEANQELKTLDEAKSHFMILIGHELKTPLTTMNSYLQLLKEEVSGAELKKYVERVGQGAEKLNQIVFDVLDLMSAETSQLKVHKKKNSFSPLINSSLENLKAEISKKNLDVKKDLDVDSTTFDAQILTKVMGKIFHNAVKFADEGSTIHVTTEKSDGEVVVTVTNRGPEISEDEIEKIKKPFMLTEDIMNHSQGLGLGLALCQSLLKRHGSQLEIQSGAKKTSVSFKI